MPVLKIRIDSKDFEIECGKGEEELLRKAEQLLNLKINNHKEFKNLSETKKYLMIALILISENIVNENKNKKIYKNFKEIIEELDKLEEIIK